MFQHIKASNHTIIRYKTLIFLFFTIVSSLVYSQTGIVIPLYTYPTDSSWSTLITVHNGHPSVPMIAIINPSNGPGTYDPNFAIGINSLTTNGIIVLGYVHTGFGFGGLRPIATIESLIDNYSSWYTVNGILFDEMANIAGDEAYYTTLSTYALSKGYTYTMGNPGTSTIPSYIGTENSMCIYESSGLPSLTTLASSTFNLLYPKSNFCYIALGIAYNPTFENSSSQYVQWLYMTDASGSNPYNKLPTYFSQEVATLDGNTTTTTTSTTTTTTISSVSGNPPHISILTWFYDGSITSIDSIVPAIAPYLISGDSIEVHVDSSGGISGAVEAQKILNKFSNTANVIVVPADNTADAIVLCSDTQKFPAGIQVFRYDYEPGAGFTPPSQYNTTASIAYSWFDKAENCVKAYNTRTNSSAKLEVALTGQIIFTQPWNWTTTASHMDIFNMQIQGRQSTSGFISLANSVVTPAKLAISPQGKPTEIVVHLTVTTSKITSTFTVQDLAGVTVNTSNQVQGINMFFPFQTEDGSNVPGGGTYNLAQYIKAVDSYNRVPAINTTTTTSTSITSTSTSSTSVTSTTSTSTTSSSTSTSIIPQFQIKVQSVDLYGQPITGLFVQVNSSNNTVIKNGYTPITFTLTQGVGYKIYTSNFGKDIFDHWGNNANSSQYIAVTPNRNIIFTEYYNTNGTTTTSTSSTSTSSTSSTTSVNKSTSSSSSSTSTSTSSITSTSTTSSSITTTILPRNINAILKQNIMSFNGVGFTASSIAVFDVWSITLGRFQDFNNYVPTDSNGNFYFNTTLTRGENYSISIFDSSDVNNAVYHSITNVTPGNLVTSINQSVLKLSASYFSPNSHTLLDIWDITSGSFLIYNFGESTDVNGNWTDNFGTSSGHTYSISVFDGVSPYQAQPYPNPTHIVITT